MSEHSNNRLLSHGFYWVENPDRVRQGWFHLFHVSWVSAGRLKDWGLVKHLKAWQRLQGRSPSRVAPFYGPRALGVLTVRKPDFPRASDLRETLAGIEVPFKTWPWNSCTIASIIFHSLEVSQ